MPTDISFEGQFGGTVLATKAFLKSNNDIEGNVHVRTLAQQGQIHAFEFQGNVTAVPEPESYAMMPAVWSLWPASGGVHFDADRVAPQLARAVDA